jgi:YbgC/YbaW family acyl-CoA thioester hydrolase
VRFGEIDEAGIVYYPQFFHLCHLAMEEFFERAVGVPYPEIVQGWKVGFPAVHVEADFLGPLKYGDVLLIAVSFVKVGRSSVHMRYRGRRQSDGKQACEAKITTVCVDMTTFRARAIPDELRAIFEQYRDEGAGDAPGEVLTR